MISAQLVTQAGRVVSGNVDAVSKVLLDKKRSLARIEARGTRALYRAGGYAKKVMKGDLSRPAAKKKKTRKKHGGARKPPYAHTFGMANATAFVVDAKTMSVVVGVGKTKFWDDANIITARSLPELLDKGGKKYNFDGSGKRIVSRYRPHPFKRRAYEKGMELLAKIVERDGLV